MTEKLLAAALLTLTAMHAAPGKLTLDGKTFDLTHVYARKGPDDFDKTKLSTYLLACDRELDAATRVDPSAVRELVWDGKLNAVQIQLDGAGISWSIKSAAVKTSLSGSQSPNPYDIQVNGDRVTGMVKMAKPGELGDTVYYFEFPVDARIEVKREPPPPTAADKAAAANSAAAKAYLAYQAVLMKGDKAGLMKAVDPEKAAMIDTPEFPQMIKFIQQMQPKNIVVLRATETGDTAELLASGNAGADTGTVKMKRINGSWLVMKESWQKR
jgi:hypothetical protein